MNIANFDIGGSVNTVDSLKQTALEFDQLNLLPTNDVKLLSILLSQTMDKLCHQITTAENQGIGKDQIIDILKPVRKVFYQSPFLFRCQEWPRGYHGDFETIEYLVNGTNKAPNKTLAYCCEHYALNSPIAQQHRNKILQQKQIIIETLQFKKRPNRILSIASGGSIDIRKALFEYPCSNSIFVINDIDKDALDFAKSKLSPYEDTCSFNYIPGNVFRLVGKRVKPYGTFDAILTGGLFDYLPDKAVCYILNGIFNNLLDKGSRLFFTNIGKNNPYSPWLIYMFNWILIERDEQDILKLIKDAQIENNFQVKIWRDSTNLTCLIEMIKQ